MKRRDFLKLIGIASVAPSLPLAKSEPQLSKDDIDEIVKILENHPNTHDVTMIEDNKKYKCLPNSGPKHYVGQILYERAKGLIWICVVVEDNCSKWKIKKGTKEDYDRMYEDMPKLRALIENETA